jgi:hypothetical protein
VSVQWTYDGRLAHGVSLQCLTSANMHYDTFWYPGSVPPGPGRHTFTITVTDSTGQTDSDTYYLNL